jgi:GIY-YIG catalytic domain
MKNKKFNLNNSRDINSNNCNNTPVIPIIIYNSVDRNKCSILEENRNKSGVYRFVNTINGKSYIGSSIHLSNKFNSFYNLSSLTSQVKGSIIIYRALLKYGYKNFSLNILEYCESNMLIEREQYYINIIKPEYNILGSKHSKMKKNPN